MVGNTLSFWRGCWDVDKVTAAAGTAKGKVGDNGEEGEKARALAEWNRERFETLKGVVDGYLKRCGWMWVQMGALFAFAIKDHAVGKRGGRR